MSESSVESSSGCSRAIVDFPCIKSKPFVILGLPAFGTLLSCIGDIVRFWKQASFKVLETMRQSNRLATKGKIAGSPIGHFGRK